MIKFNFIILAVVSVLTGCVASHQAIAPNVKRVKLPEINVISTSSLGERMLESGKVTTIDGFKLRSDVAIFDAIVKAGEFHQIGVKENHKVFAPKSGYGTGVVDVFGVRSPAKPYIDEQTGSLCFLGGFGTRFCSDDVKPNVVKMNIYTEDNFMQELIYTGKVGDKIRFTFREFQNGMARQAFNVNVEYDLSESNLISYKGATVEILSATNQKIEYKVIKHFN
jgi:hypothetical protein